MNACTQHNGCRATKRTVLAWMRANAADYRDRLTDEPQYTQLAEAAAYEFDHNEWLDDDQHPVWDWSIEALAPKAVSA